MSSTQTIKTMAATLTVGVLLAGFFAATGFAGDGVSKAVQARAKATNEFYGVGTVDSKAVQARAQAMNGFYGSGAAAALKAEKLRSAATNEFYGVGTVESKAVQARAQAMNGFYGSGAAAALKAEKLRSAALNRYYGLGVDSKQVQRAELRRSQAINQAYRLGQYAVIGGSNSFDWADAGIGAGAMLGTLLIAGGLAVVARRRVSSPTTT
jgi:hypothetical protein